MRSGAGVLFSSCSPGDNVIFVNGKYRGFFENNNYGSQIHVNFFSQIFKQVNFIFACSRSRHSKEIYIILISLDHCTHNLDDILYNFFTHKNSENIGFWQALSKYLREGSY